MKNLDTFISMKFDEFKNHMIDPLDDNIVMGSNFIIKKINSEIKFEFLRISNKITNPIFNP